MSKYLLWEDKFVGFGHDVEQLGFDIDFAFYRLMRGRMADIQPCIVIKTVWTGFVPDLFETIAQIDWPETENKR